MDYTLIKESDYFVAWILFWLCRVIGGFIVGFIAGGLVGLVLASAGVRDSGMIKIAGAITGFIVSVPLSYILFRLFVGKFIVQIIERRIAEIQSQHAVR